MLPVGDAFVSDLESSGCVGNLAARRLSPIAVGHPWFAVRVKSNCERSVATQLRQKGYPEFLPSYRVQSRWSDRIKAVERPLFPGYLFCSFDPSCRLPILTTPGVLHVLGVGRDPVPVERAEVESLWITLQAGLVVRPWPSLQVGESVVIERGPLKGVEGFVTEFKGVCRLVVSISLLRRSVAAEVEREWVRPASSSASSRKMGAAAIS